MLAEKNFDLLKKSPRHPSLQFKKVGLFWSARVGLTHRALAVKDSEGFIWVWIGTHDDYERMISDRSFATAFKIPLSRPLPKGGTVFLSLRGVKRRSNPRVVEHERFNRGLPRLLLARLGEWLAMTLRD